MAILTDKQLIYVIGGAALLLYLAGKKASAAVGDVIAHIPDLPSKIYDDVLKPPVVVIQKLALSQLELDWITDVKGITGMVARNDAEKKIIVSFMPNSIVQTFDFIVGPYIYLVARNAADAVTDYRKKNGLPN